MDEPRPHPPGIDRLLDETPKFGSGIGLHRMLTICGDLMEGDWWRSLDSIRITGSNGKGSTAAMVASILAQLDIDVGQYTSPHLIRFNERIRCGGMEISDDDVAACVDWYYRRSAALARSDPGETTGAFEAITAMALYYFSLKKPAALVAEVGIGGRFDPVRVIPGSITGLSALDLEHTGVLGDSLEAIAYDKIDLCEAGGTLVCGVVDPALRRRIISYCRIKDLRLLDATEAIAWEIKNLTRHGSTVDFTMEGRRLDGVRINLAGKHQVGNAALAIVLASVWLRRNRPGTAASEFADAVRGGLRSVTWPGRFQQVHEDPVVFVDVGHSPGATDALVQTVRDVWPARPLLLVTGVSYDKEVELIASKLATVADRVICTRAYHKGAEVGRVAGVVREARPDLQVDEAPTIEEAVATACRIATDEDMDVLVGGGLFLSIEAMQCLDERDPQRLRFF